MRVGRFCPEHGQPRPDGGVPRHRPSPAVAVSRAPRVDASVELVSLGLLRSARRLLLLAALPVTLAFCSHLRNAGGSAGRIILRRAEREPTGRHAESPWDLQTALNHPAVHPGDTIWMRGGTYREPSPATSPGPRRADHRAPVPGRAGHDRRRKLQRRGDPHDLAAPTPGSGDSRS